MLLELILNSMNGLLSINRGTYYMIFLGNAGYNLCIDNIMIRSKLLLFKGLIINWYFA